jgi:hypothetical protein
VDLIRIVPVVRLEHTLHPENTVGRYPDALLFNAEALLQTVVLGTALIVEVAVVTADAAVATVLRANWRQNQAFGESRSASMAFDLKRADLLKEILAMAS